MPRTAKLPEPSKPIILFDNNSIQHALNKNLGAELQPLLQELAVTHDAIFAISDVIIYESLKAIVNDEAKFKIVADFIDEQMTRYPLDENILVAAARLHELYGYHSETKGHKMSSEDIIIGATAILTGAYVFTSDCNDFPRPFFTEFYRGVFFYEEKGRRRHVVKYLLEPDTDTINSVLEEQLAKQ